MCGEKAAMKRRKEGVLGDRKALDFFLAVLCLPGTLMQYLEGMFLLLHMDRSRDPKMLPQHC